MRELRKFGQGLVRQSVLVPLVAVYAAGHMLDVLSTFIALRFYGAREGNPFMFWLNLKIPGKWFAISALKLWHVKSSWSIYKFSEELRSLIFLTVIVWAIVLWNFSVILRRRNARS